MPEVQWTRRFLRCYEELPDDIRRKVIKTLRLLAGDVRHPSLQTKSIRGAPGLFEARVDLRYRLTYERLPGDVLLLRVVGMHDDALEED